MRVLMNIVLLLLMVAPTLAAEVATCDDPRVLELLQNGTFEKTKAPALELTSSGSPGPNTPKLLAALNQWQSKIENIRQSSYDAENDARYCSASVFNSQLPIDLALVILSSGIHDSSCAHSINYKIERLLDKPGGFNVSWQCH